MEDKKQGLVNGGVDANESFFLLFDTLRHYEILDLVRHALLISRRLQLDYLTNIMLQTQVVGMFVYA